MIENELSEIWKSSPQEEQVKFDKARFMLEVQSNLDAFYRQVKISYISEAVGALITLPLYVYFTFLVPSVLTKIAFVLIAVMAGFILFVVRTSQAKIPDQFAMTYLDYLKATKVYLEKQYKFRKNIFIGYILPFVLCIWLAALGEYLENPDLFNPFLLMGIVSLIAGIVIHFFNQKSAKNVLAPKLDKVNSLIKVLQE